MKYSNAEDFSGSYELAAVNNHLYYMAPVGHAVSCALHLVAYRSIQQVVAAGETGEHDHTAYVH